MGCTVSMTSKGEPSGRKYAYGIAICVLYDLLQYSPTMGKSAIPTTGHGAPFPYYGVTGFVWDAPCTRAILQTSHVTALG